MAKRSRTSHVPKTGQRPRVRVGARILDAPVFSQPEPTPDPSTFKIIHPSDDAAYKLIDELNTEHKIKPLPFPMPRGGAPEPQLSLANV